MGPDTHEVIANPDLKRQVRYSRERAGSDTEALHEQAMQAGTAFCWQQRTRVLGVAVLCSNCQSDKHARCCARCGVVHTPRRRAYEFCSVKCERAQRREDLASAKSEQPSRPDPPLLRSGPYACS